MSDEGTNLEERKSELFATITLLAAVKRDIITARGRRRVELIDRQAQLESDKERLSHEVNSQYMYRNLQAFMNRVDDYDTARMKEAKETQDGIAALGRQFHTLAESVNQLESRMDDSEHDRAGIHARLARIEQILAARPAQREAEHADLLAAIIKAHGDAQ